MTAVRRSGVELGRELQASLLPPGIASERLLFRADVRMGGIDLVVTGFLKGVKDILVFGSEEIRPPASLSGPKVIRPSMT